jgi:hypothetical protein
MTVCFCLDVCPQQELIFQSELITTAVVTADRRAGRNNWLFS